MYSSAVIALKDCTIERMLQRLAAALHFDVDLPADVIVEHILEREKLRDGLAVDRHQNVAGRQHAVGAGSRLHVVRPPACRSTSG